MGDEPTDGDDDSGYIVIEAEVPEWLKLAEAERVTVESEKIRCDGCGYEWEPRVDQPKQCPNDECHAKLVYSNQSVESVLAETSVNVDADEIQTQDSGGGDDGGESEEQTTDPIKQLMESKNDDG